jgi:hypothetical protein
VAALLGARVETSTGRAMGGHVAFALTVGWTLAMWCPWP